MSTSVLRPSMNLLSGFGLTLLCSATLVAQGNSNPPRPTGQLVDIGGQRIHISCTGTGSPTVLLEAGAGDFSVVWSLVQTQVGQFTRVCSYDRGGYAWSDPGNQPRTFAQLALELHTALERIQAGPPYVLVGQSYGGLVVRGFAARYKSEVVGMVLVDAVHEDERIVYGGEPHRLRDAATERRFPEPRIALDTRLMNLGRDSASQPATGSLDSPLDRLPEGAQTIWRWAESQPVYRQVQPSEMNWSPEELRRMHERRLSNRQTLGDMPLIVLARTDGDYQNGMSISADSLERERRALAADLARLSSRGQLIFAGHSGHNIHLEDPDLVIRSVQEIVDIARGAR